MVMEIDFGHVLLLHGIYLLLHEKYSIPGVDPRFSRGEYQTYILSIFPKTDEIENILVCRKGVRSGCPLDPPLHTTFSFNMI